MYRIYKCYEVEIWIFQYILKFSGFWLKYLFLFLTFLFFAWRFCGFSTEDNHCQHMLFYEKAVYKKVVLYKQKPYESFGTSWKKLIKFKKRLKLR